MSVSNRNGVVLFDLGLRKIITKTLNLCCSVLNRIRDLNLQPVSIIYTHHNSVIYCRQFTNLHFILQNQKLL